MQHDFRVRCRIEVVPALLQVLAQLNVVEDLAVVHDPQRLVLIVNGLTPRVEIDDTESHVPQPNPIVHIDAGLVGAAMANHTHHPPQVFRVNVVRGRQPTHAYNATHDTNLTNITTKFATRMEQSLYAGVFSRRF